MQQQNPPLTKDQLNRVQKVLKTLSNRKPTTILRERILAFLSNCYVIFQLEELSNATITLKFTITIEEAMKELKLRPAIAKRQIERASFTASKITALMNSDEKFKKIVHSEKNKQTKKRGRKPKKSLKTSKPKRKPVQSLESPSESQEQENESAESVESVERVQRVQKAQKVLRSSKKIKKEVITCEDRSSDSVQEVDREDFADRAVAIPDKKPQANFYRELKDYARQNRHVNAAHIMGLYALNFFTKNFGHV